MYNGIVYYPNSRNRGDDIQSYAASLLTEDAVLCDREHLNNIDKPIKLLCNGWFMENGANWPPNHKVNPLFLSFHISSKSQRELTSPSSLAYFKQHQPIGCRDTHTLNLLQKHNIASFLSGCLTLTLPNYTGQRGDDILFVDVLRTNYTSAYRKAIVSRMIPKKYRVKIQFVTHFSDEMKSKTSQERMNEAKLLLDRYKKAKLVFTSLIHCALPCIAQGTPVVFIDAGFNNNHAKRDRFGGVTDLFPAHLHVDLPFGKRTFLHKLVRITGFYRLFLHTINPIDDSLFQLTQTKPTHIKMANRLKKSVSNFFS
jgi:hypothetical protein